VPRAKAAGEAINAVIRSAGIVSFMRTIVTAWTTAHEDHSFHERTFRERSVRWHRSPLIFEFVNTAAFRARDFN
jgi:hypothetical protein